MPYIEASYIKGINKVELINIQSNETVKFLFLRSVSSTINDARGKVVQKRNFPGQSILKF